MGECSTKFDFGKTTLTEGNDVKMAPLDMLGLPKVNVVKIDVEGKELVVLVGMRLTIDNWKPHLLIEMQDEKTYPDTYDFLNDLGYNMYWLAVPTYNSNNHKQNTQNVFGPQHGVINWVCSAELLNTKLQPVVDRDDSIERMVYRSRKMWEMIERMASDPSGFTQAYLVVYLEPHFCFGLKIQEWLCGQ